ncbi:hypothetical protein [Bacillus sp. D386]|uniref:hypothetical protein n=1 Tax=Bacillus sp. D386 TaxID=2587155 RepID=UPI0011214841|nr:hypothetical protein [Bacillus sp. D386]
MANIIDWLLIIISSVLFYNSLKRILNYKSSSVADYIIAVIYIFNCLPVLMDNTIGIPSYYSWYSYFEIALGNDKVSIVYSIYLLLTISILSLYTRYDNKESVKIVYTHNNSVVFNKYILPIVILLPYIHIIITGNVSKYFVYGTYSARGLTNSFYQMNSILVFLSIFAFCCLFFYKVRYKSLYFLLLLYAISIIWIDGKRYIIVTLLLMFLFFYLNSIQAKEKRLPIKPLFALIATVFILFNAIYAIYVKPIATNSFDSLYMTYRIDFGRDDVTKFVLYKELVEDDPILEYRGQTFISTVFMPVPREIWPSKPFPHYRYLTAELYGTSPMDIPAGMTPSLFEMSIANLGVALGILFTILLLLILCRWADNCKSVPRKALYLMLIIGLLTQSLDAMLVYYILAPLSAFLTWFKWNYARRKHLIN